MSKPVHPSDILKSLISDKATTQTIMDIEDHHKLLRGTLVTFLNEKTPVTTKLANILERITGVKAVDWIRRQDMYNFWDLKQRNIKQDTKTKIIIKNTCNSLADIIRHDLNKLGINYEMNSFIDNTIKKDIKKSLEEFSLDV